MVEDFKLIVSTIWIQISSLFFLLLLISACILFFLSERIYGVIISIILLIDVTLGFIKEFKASKASLKRLQKEIHTGKNLFTGTFTENKLKVFAVSDVRDFWESSNTISEGEYERLPMDDAYDNALNASIGKLKTGAHTLFPKIVNFVPFKNEVGYEVFTLEGGEKIARGQIKKILKICKTSHPSVRASALEYEMKGMRVLALARGIAGVWDFSGFVAFHDPIKISA